MIKKELVIINEKDNQKQLQDWLEQNQEKLAHISENEGCGCCVDIFYVEGSEEIINTFPKELLS